MRTRIALTILRVLIPGSRIDFDAPKAGEAFVIRIESADGRRLLTRCSHGEASVIQRVTARVLRAKADGLITVFTDVAPEGFHPRKPSTPAVTVTKRRGAT